MKVQTLDGRWSELQPGGDTSGKRYAAVKLFAEDLAHIRWINDHVFTRVVKIAPPAPAPRQLPLF